MNREIKLIVTDLDGTFVPSLGELIPENLAALRAAKEAGIRVCACTGRHWNFARCVLEAGEFDPLCITSNGAAIVETHTGRYEKLSPIDPQRLDEVLEFLLEEAPQRASGPHTFDRNGYGGRGGAEYVRTCNKDYFSTYNPNQGEFMVEVRSYPWRMDYPIVTRSYRDYAHWVDSTRQDTERILYDIGRNGMEDCQALKERLAPLLPLEVTSAYGTIMEIMAPDATKGNALTWLSRHYEVPREQILAIGDNINDIPMIRWAGVGVAVSDGHPALLEQADLIAPSCREGAVAKIIADCAAGRLSL